ncbi:MAG: beta-galactosidase [Armatimonadota bacterium]
MLPMLLVLVVCCLLTVSVGCSSEGETAPLSDDYHVIMWALGGVPENEDLYFQRLHDLHVQAIHVHPGESPDPALAHGIGFYLENIHRIAFLHEREPIYKSDWDNYTRTRDKRYLLRDPCLNDPAYLASAREDIQSKIRRFAAKGPLLYDLGDECSITSFASPMDYDFSPDALAAFRKWLQSQYGSLEALNREWETSFATWDEVVPMTTYEIKDREKTGSENYSPWADHRTFMDISFADSWRQFREWVREVDPKTPVGLEGLQMPATFGGYDLWRLSQALDWIEPYDIGESHAIFRSFMPGAPIYATLFEHDPNAASRRLWHLLLNGDHGVIIWAASEWFDFSTPELKPQPWVSGMAELFAELRGPAAQAIMRAKRDRAPIAIHYSHPSIQAGWMIDSREDGDTWPRRFSSYEAVHSRITRVRSSWCRALEDLGYDYDFVSTQQILDGVLEQRGYKAFIMPESLAISDSEAAAIQRYAESGGTVIADFLPGVFDEHAKRRTAGALDGFFGVSRKAQTGMVAQPDVSLDSRGALLAAEPALTASDRAVGKGRAVYLNISPIDYSKLRLVGEGAAIREAIAQVLAKCDIARDVTVTIDGGPPVGCEVITYRDGEARYIAVMRRPEYQIGSLGEIGYTDNSRFEQPVEVTVTFDQPVNAKELLSGRELGEGREFRLTLGPWKPVVVEVR